VHAIWTRADDVGGVVLHLVVLDLCAVPSRARELCPCRYDDTPRLLDMSSRQRALSECTFCGYQTQEGSAKNDARNCDMVTIDCPCLLSSESPFFETLPHHIKSCKIQASGPPTPHCDLCNQEGHTAMTIRYDSLYEKVSMDDPFVPREEEQRTCGLEWTPLLFLTLL